MNEAERLARNTQRLTELYPVFAARVAAIIAELQAAGYRPRIQSAWRSPEDQLIAFNTGRSKLTYGFHNVTGAGGAPESLAVDLLDDDSPLNSRSEYLLHLAAAASTRGCQTGIEWGLPPGLRAAVKTAIAAADWNAQLKFGWDPTHVEPTDVTVDSAMSGARPKEPGAAAPAGAAKKPKVLRRRKVAKKRRSRGKK